jgi:hypothetical protein
MPISFVVSIYSLFKECHSVYFTPSIVLTLSIMGSRCNKIAPSPRPLYVPSPLIQHESSLFSDDIWASVLTDVHTWLYCPLRGDHVECITSSEIKQRAVKLCGHILTQAKLNNPKHHHRNLHAVMCYLNSECIALEKPSLVPPIEAGRHRCMVTGDQSPTLLQFRLRCMDHKGNQYPTSVVVVRPACYPILVAYQCFVRGAEYIADRIRTNILHDRPPYTECDNIRRILELQADLVQNFCVTVKMDRELYEEVKQQKSITW